MSSLLLRRSLVGFIGLSITLSILGSATGANAKPRWPSLPSLTDLLQLPRNTTQPPQTIPVPPTNTTQPPAPQPQPTDQGQGPLIPQVEVETGDTAIARFRCEVIGGQYTVMYYPVSQPNQGYAWAVPSNMGGGWTPERRCGEISRRLESYRPDGLAEISTAIENGYNTLCATTEDIPQCRIVLTVPPGEDPLFVRDRIFQNLVIADSGQSTQGVLTLIDEKSTGDIIRGALGRPRTLSTGIPLRQFLDPTDGGTGSRLNPRYFPK
ncbi:COP23 domain-containing protein [Planktothrix agardhii]|uniref:COP23 domain-containing protein n=1 Tax=Planktothrix agardhii TaxID=1160 RepID=UPI002876D51B|nr:COP23 domain-containing protein [Planktothrix agardhii]MDS1344740.1 COP23 domain-containing protein [Planktothrix agardhii NRERC-751]